MTFISVKTAAPDHAENRSPFPQQDYAFSKIRAEALGSTLVSGITNAPVLEDWLHLVRFKMVSTFSDQMKRSFSNAEKV